MNLLTEIGLPTLINTICMYYVSTNSVSKLLLKANTLVDRIDIIIIIDVNRYT